VLREAAAAAARQPPGRGRYFATEIQTVYSYCSPACQELNPAGVSVTIQWFGNGGTARLAALEGSPYGIYTGPPGLWAQLQRLPPRRLQAAIAEAASRYRGAVPQVFAEFSLIESFLAAVPGSPALRSALYQVAATLPGLTLVPHTRDPIGRTATEVYIRAEYPFNALYFSPSTGAFLDMASYPSNCSGIWGAAVLASGYVSSKVQLPAGAVRTARPVVRLSHGCFKPTGPPSPTVTMMGSTPAVNPFPGPTPTPTLSPSASPSLTGGP